MTITEIAAIPGLQYIQLPRPELAWWPGMKPHARVSIEHWPGYVDTATVPIRDVDADALAAAGWQSDPLRDWTRYHPPEGPSPPAPGAHMKEAPDSYHLSGAEAENAEPSTKTDSTTSPPPAPSPRPRVVAARYADGRPARYSDGTIVRYTAGGRPVELPARNW